MKQRTEWATTLGTIGGLAALVGFAFRPALAGRPPFWTSLGVGYLLAGTLAVVFLKRRQALGRLLRPRAGDLTVGVGLGLLLLLVSWAGRTLLASPGTERMAWLLGVYLQIGDPDIIQNSVSRTGLLLLLPALNELVFRGWMQEVFLERLGKRAAWLASTAACGLVALPTIFTLMVPGLGPNPLLFLAAVFGSLVLGFTRHLTHRLPAVVIAHAVFAYFSVVQFRAI